MTHCTPDNVVVNKVGGQSFDGPLPHLLYIEMNSIAKTGASGAQMQAMRIVDAGSELERVRLIASKYGGVPVAVAMAFRITQTVVMPAVASGTVARFDAPFRERHALTELLVAPGKLSDAYFRGVTRKIGPLNDRMCVSIAPGIVQEAFQLLGASFGQHFNADASQQAAAFSGAPQFNQAKPLYGMAPAQLRTVYAAAGVTEPRAGSPNGDLLVFPFTVDGIDGDVSKAGIALERITDGSGSSYWTWTFTPYDNTALYYDDGAGHTFGNITITPILVYRIERPAVGPDGVKAVTEAEVWEDRFNLPTTDTSVTPFSSADVQDHSFVGWLPDVWDDSTDAGNYYFLNVDTGPTPDYTPVLRVIPPSFDPSRDLWTNGNYFSIGDGAVEQFPNDVSANGARYISDVNSLNGFNSKQPREANPPPIGMFAEMHDYGQSGFRSATYTFCVSGLTSTLRYGADWATGIPVNAFDSTIPGVAGTAIPTAQLGGPQFWPIAFCNKGRSGFPGVAVRAVGDMRPIVLTKVGSATTPTRPNGGSTVGWRVSLQRTRGVFAQCAGNSKGTPGVSPIVFDPGSAKARIGQLLSPSAATVLPSSLPSGK